MREQFQTFMGWVGLGLFIVLFAASFGPDTQAASLATGHTFTNAETVTAANLNAAINSATVTNITSGDFADLAVTLGKMAADSVNSAKIVNLSIAGGVGGDINYGTITTTNILTGTFTGREFSSTFNWPAGTLNFTNAITFNFNTNAIPSVAILGTNASPGSAASGLVPKLNAAHGKLDPTLYYAPSTNATIMAANDQGEVTYQTLATVTTTATNGAVFVIGKGTYDDAGTGSGVIGLRITDSTGAMLDGSAFEVGTDVRTATITCFAVDVLQGAAKTYNLQGIINGTPEANAQWVISGASRSDADVLLTNGTRIAAIQIPAP